jgi:cyanophycinase
MQRFAQLAGGPNASVVVIPTTMEEEDLTSERLERIRSRVQEILGVARVTVLHTRDRKVADSEAFVEPLRHATGVWILGGEDTYLMQAYGGTRTEQEIKNVVARGGVLGGTSAGAIIQGSIAVSGKIVDDPNGPGGKGVKVESTRPCFGLLANTMVAPHWTQRGIRDLLGLAVATQPGTLTIAIDEATAAIVTGDQLEVVGDGNVGIYDGLRHDGRSYLLLSPGQRFDLKKRALLPAA